MLARTHSIAQTITRAYWGTFRISQLPQRALRVGLISWQVPLELRCLGSGLIGKMTPMFSVAPRRKQFGVDVSSSEYCVEDLDDLKSLKWSDMLKGKKQKTSVQILLHITIQYNIQYYFHRFHRNYRHLNYRISAAIMVCRVPINRHRM